MRIVISGGHGQIARRLARLLVARGDDVVSVVRQPEHVAVVGQDGASAMLLDLELTDVARAVVAVDGADAVVFAAGAGPGSGVTRKDSVDRGGAVLMAAAAERAGVRRHVQISSMGTEHVRGGAVPAGVEPVFVAYLQAKLAAEDDLRSRTGLDWTIVRPGRLTDAAGTARVTLAPTVPRGSVARDDVAAVVVALLDNPGTSGQVLELTEGLTPIDDAVAAVVQTNQES